MQASTGELRLIAAGRRGLKTPNQEITHIEQERQNSLLESGLRIYGFLENFFLYSCSRCGGVMDFVLIQPCRMRENGVMLNWLQKKKIL